MYTVHQTELGYLFSVPQSFTAVRHYNLIISVVCSPFRVTHCPSFPRTILILAVKVLKPRKFLSPKYNLTNDCRTSFIFLELYPSPRFQHFCFVESPEEYK